MVLFKLIKGLFTGSNLLLQRSNLFLVRPLVALNPLDLFSQALSLEQFFYFRLKPSKSFFNRAFRLQEEARTQSINRIHSTRRCRADEHEPSAQFFTVFTDLAEVHQAQGKRGGFLVDVFHDFRISYIQVLSLSFCNILLLADGIRRNTARQFKCVVVNIDPAHEHAGVFYNFLRPDLLL